MQTKERFDRESGRRKLQWRRQLFDTMARNHRDLLLNDQQIPELYLPRSKYFCSYLCSYLCSDWCSYLCSDLFVPMWADICFLYLSSQLRSSFELRLYSNTQERFNGGSGDDQQILEIYLLRSQYLCSDLYSHLCVPICVLIWVPNCVLICVPTCVPICAPICLFPFELTFVGFMWTPSCVLHLSPLLFSHLYGVSKRLCVTETIDGSI